MAEMREGLEDHVQLSDVDLKSIDVDNSGTVDYTEFIAAVLDRQAHLREDLCWSAFRVFDRDGNGRISRQEVAHVCSIADNTARMEELLKEADLNGDGEIDFEEFKSMLS